MHEPLFMPSARESFASYLDDDMRTSPKGLLLLQMIKPILSFHRRGIGIRLLLSFGLVLTLFAGTTTFALMQMGAIERDMNSALHASSEIAKRASVMSKDIDSLYITTLLLVLSKQADEIPFYKGEIERITQGYKQSKKELQALTHNGGDDAELPELLKKMDEWEFTLSEVDQVLRRRMGVAATASTSNEIELDSDMLEHMATIMRGQFNQWSQVIDKTVAVTVRIVAERKSRAIATARTARIVQISAAVMALLVGISAALLIKRTVVLPLRRAVEVAERVAQGDLSIIIPPGANDETGALLNALERMQSSLHDLVSEVRQSAVSIEIAAAEVAAGNFDLSQRTEHASSQLQRTTHSVAELSSAVRQSANSARMAGLLARDAASAAGHGGKVVMQVVHSMQAIDTQSSKIADIIGVINGIAFQTNILALNAAVEAARAGEQGRGFAVVAGEVRTLAQRSAAAAKDIKSLIEASVGSVQSGSRLVQDAGQTMEGVVTSVHKVTSAIEEISTASSWQSTGIVEVSGTMGEIDQLMQQNAALVEQSAAAADSLKQLAERLSQLVGAFKLT
nr:methyl-accepting chemotaxis protein [uncultured Rhodoferax sp.]